MMNLLLLLLLLMMMSSSSSQVMLLLLLRGCGKSLDHTHEIVISARQSRVRVHMVDEHASFRLNCLHRCCAFVEGFMRWRVRARVPERVEMLLNGIEPIFDHFEAVHLGASVHAFCGIV